MIVVHVMEQRKFLCWSVLVSALTAFENHTKMRNSWLSRSATVVFFLHLLLIIIICLQCFFFSFLYRTTRVGYCWFSRFLHWESELFVCYFLCYLFVEREIEHTVSHQYDNIANRIFRWFFLFLWSAWNLYTLTYTHPHAWRMDIFWKWERDRVRARKSNWKLHGVSVVSV